jgi:tripeptidyl-peptidase-2
MGYILPEKAHRDSSHENFFGLTGVEQKTEVLNVVPGTSLEVCLAQFWSSLGESLVDLEIVFHSIATANTSEVSIFAPKNWARVDVWSPVRVENLSPAANLTTLRQPLRPTIAEIKPLRDARRNNLPNNRQVYELVLTYPFEVKDKGSSTVTPRIQLLQGVLYESIYGAQLWMIFDANKNHVGTGDAFPDGISLPKGKYTLRVNVRHDRLPLLEGLKDLVITLDTKLSKAISVPIYATYNDLVAKSGSFGTRPVEVGGRRALWLGVPDNGSLKSINTNQGDLLVGFLTLGNGGPKTPQSDDKDKRPGRIALSLVVPPRKSCSCYFIVCLTYVCMLGDNSTSEESRSTRTNITTSVITNKWFSYHITCTNSSVTKWRNQGHRHTINTRCCTCTICFTSTC